VLLRRVQGPPATVTPTAAPIDPAGGIDLSTAKSDASSSPPRDDSNVFYRELEYLHTDNSSHSAGPVVQLRLRSPAAKVMAEGSPAGSSGAPRGGAAITLDDAAAVAQFEAADEKRRAARSTRHSVCVAIAPTGGSGNPVALTGSAWLLYFAAAPTALAASEDCPAVLLCGGRMSLVATEATTCAAAAKLHQLLWRALQFDPAALCFEAQAVEGAAAATRATFPDVPAWVADAVLKLIAQPPRSMDESGQTIRHEPALSP
jgi:hypothetical protein